LKGLGFQPNSLDAIRAKGSARRTFSDIQVAHGIVDGSGKRVLIEFNKDGTLSFSANATPDIIRICTDLNATPTGRQQLKNAINSPVRVSLQIQNVVKPYGSGGYVFGETPQGNSQNPKGNYSKYVDEKGRYGITEAKVTIYEGSIKRAIASGSRLKLECLTLEEAIGTVAAHELVHATDAVEIDKDLKYLQKNQNTDKKHRPDGEKKAETVEEQVMLELRKQNPR